MPSGRKDTRIGAPVRLAKKVEKQKVRLPEVRLLKVRLLKVRLLAILFAGRRHLGAIRKTNGFAPSPKHRKKI